MDIIMDGAPRPGLYRPEWRSEMYDDVDDRLLTTEYVEAKMAESGWAKAYCILFGSYWLFGSEEALARFEETSLD